MKTEKAENVKTIAEVTPMTAQYRKIKERTQDAILFFRLGDFYEMFDDDARVASRELDLVLTSRDRSPDKPQEERVPMCGIPYHAAEMYIARLVAKGYKVAICEQMEDPAKAKGLVKRDIIRIITPGTLTDSRMLEESRSNYICSIYLDAASGACCFADISTGEFNIAAFNQDIPGHIANELARYAPSEVILSAGAAEEGKVAEYLKLAGNCLSAQQDALFSYMEAAARMCEQFNVSSTDDIGFEDCPAAVCAGGALLAYLFDTQKTALTNINTLNFYTVGAYLELDPQTRKNLELTANLSFGDKKSSLLWVLDKTKTSLGSRLMRAWIEKPLLSVVEIRDRLAAVGELYQNQMLRDELFDNLRHVGDMERLIGKVIYGSANCRDLVALSSSAAVITPLKALLSEVKSRELLHIKDMDALTDICKAIDETICDEPPILVREGGFIREGFNEEVDRLRHLTENSREAVAEIENSERERTGIKKLKVGYNRVFGYYIDIPRAQSEEVPENYIRRQTLANSERFITQELKELEATLLTANDRLCELEHSLFVELCAKLANETARLRESAARIAKLDVLCSLAEVAQKNNYCEPEVDLSSVIDIKDGRHPVVEAVQTNGLFVPNDVFLNCADYRAAIITGPNMAGKSTYMRQTALIVLMAQIGSYVPAKSAHIGICDRIFTRIGASDDLAGGRSTFMVEMTEVAEILKNASKRSLLILDEIGRGTSTFDGMAVARAVLEYCVSKIGAKTLFATHYHELATLEKELEGVKNYNIAAKKRGDSIIFLRRIVPGSTDDSYGIEVAKLAGVPETVIKRAKVVLQQLSESQGKPCVYEEREEEQISVFSVSENAITEKLQKLDLNTITPIEAMNILFELKKEAGK